MDFHMGGLLYIFLYKNILLLKVMVYIIHKGVLGLFFFFNKKYMIFGQELLENIFKDSPLKIAITKSSTWRTCIPSKMLKTTHDKKFKFTRFGYLDFENKKTRFLLKTHWYFCFFLIQYLLSNNFYNNIKETVKNKEIF